VKRRAAAGRRRYGLSNVKIPVFVSCPTSLSAEQNAARELVLVKLTEMGLEPRAVGRSDYPTQLPLREVLVLARHCSGGVILGFGQYRSLEGIEKFGTEHEREEHSPRSFPTPWNQLEAGILFAQSLPLLIFREPDVSGGIFDYGVTDVFVHDMPIPGSVGAAQEALGAVFLKWQAEVRQRYYAL
jgi:hypothetical protein